ncbi:MAG: hypothetical protein KME30_11430 [Iphinoe sp. HA4291-MV1]|nr:hypothetical protein [Iphinoe sp. HA4291-MV1]
MSGTLLQRILVMPTQINKTKVPLISRGQCVNWYTKITTFHGAIFPEEAPKGSRFAKADFSLVLAQPHRKIADS